MSDCVFCGIVSGEIPCMKVYEAEAALAFMDIAGDVDGHILVIPKRHCTNILDCHGEDLSAVMHAVRKVSLHLTEVCGYEGVNLLNASGESAGQSVPHFHIHIIPRKSGDGIDGWPAFGGAKEDIRAVYERVRMGRVPPMIP
ncbi:MAG: HIT family protein [Clostridia bacterium]|nr:HIT family protein [Clostridia bacterium]